MAQFIEYASVVGKAPSDSPPVATLTAGLRRAQRGQHPGAIAAQQIRLVLVVAAIDPPISASP